MFSALENGNITVTDVLQDPPYCLRRIRAYDVLRRIPKLGRDGAETVLRRSKVWPLTAMGNLSIAERSRILHELPPRVRK